jgi:MFS family permease
VETEVNRKRLLLAGFLAIFAAGFGFAVRGGIFANWGAQFGFTGAQLGAIGGAGFTGFCFGIIVAGVLADKLGYGLLVLAAFALHTVSAFVTFGATGGVAEQASAYNFLYWGMFLFALANGTLEGVANPLVATLFPENRTHYLNILHASWPAGLVAGGMVGWYLGGPADSAICSWKIQLGLYLVPTVLYGVLFLGQHMPKSEASRQGLGIGEMFKDVGILGGLVICFLLALFFSGMLTPLLTPENANAETVAAAAHKAAMIGYGIAGVLLLVVALITKFSIGAWLLFALFVAHALVGAVELGTDGWIQNITGNILTPAQGKILFVFTSLMMFALRFCAHWIEKNLKLSPPALLMVCAALAVVGLNLISGVSTFIGAMAALTVYAAGKTFFWPTMLAVASDRFPRTGAIAISIMGGIGMMSAGIIGSAGLGYAKDRFSSEALKQSKPELVAQYAAEKKSQFLFLDEVTAIDGKKLGDAQKKLDDTRNELEKSGVKDTQAAYAKLDPAESSVLQASITGDRKTLVADSFVPATMAVIYLLLLLYFKATGGYKVVHLIKENGESVTPKEEANA